MSESASDLLDVSRFYFFIAERKPTASEILKAKKIGAGLVRLTPIQLVGFYEDWTVYHREHDGGEPFIGSIVRKAIDLSTEADEALDATEGLLELMPEAFTEEDLLEAEEAGDGLAMAIGLDPELTGDSLTAHQLAMLVLAVTIEHPVSQEKTYKRRELFLRGDIKDPRVRQAVYEDFRSHRLRTEEYEDEDYDAMFLDQEFHPLDREPDDEIAELQQLIINTGGLEAFQDYNRENHIDGWYELQHESVMGDTTSIDAGLQLSKEANFFEFDFDEKIVE